MYLNVINHCSNLLDNSMNQHIYEGCFHAVNPIFNLICDYFKTNQWLYSQHCSVLDCETILHYMSYSRTLLHFPCSQVVFDQTQGWALSSMNHSSLYSIFEIYSSFCEIGLPLLLFDQKKGSLWGHCFNINSALSVTC